MSYQHNQTLNRLSTLLKIAIAGGINMPKREGNQITHIQKLIKLGYIAQSTITQRLYLTDSGRNYLNKLIRENQMLS